MVAEPPLIFRHYIKIKNPNFLINSKLGFDAVEGGGFEPIDRLLPLYCLSSIYTDIYIYMTILL